MAFPPDNVAGVFVPTRSVFVRSTSLLVVAQRFVAYPTGVDFAIQIHVHSGAPGQFAFPDPARGVHTSGPAERLAVGVVFPDGSRASSRLLPSFGEQPAGPTVVPYSGGGTADQTGWAQRCWVWPLPPAGPLRLVVAWPRAGLEESWAEVDGTALGDAGRRAQVLWQN